METAFWKRFTDLCKDKGVTPNKVMLDTGLNTASPSQWKQRGTIPRKKSLQILAAYFGVSVDYLLGAGADRVETAPEAEQNKTPDPEMPELANMGDDLLTFALFGRNEPTLPKEKLDEIRRYAQYIKDL